MSFFAALSPSLAAYLMVAGQQFLLAIGWCVASALLRSVRTAALHWAAFAALTAVSLVLVVLSVAWHDEVLRALANLLVLMSVLALQHGIRCFFSVPSPWRLHLLWLAIGIGLSWLGLSGDRGALRVGGISALLAVVNLGVAWDVKALASRRLHASWGWALAVPVALGSVLFALRALWALLAPQTVVAEVTANNPLNVGAAFMYMTVTLVFQLTLVSLVMSQMVLSLRRLARRDALTGLLNRRAMDDLLADEAHRAHRLGSSFSVLMIDVDHFKAINDRDGHAAGDRALQHLASLLSGQMRDIDRVGRYGGEEFVALLPGTALDEAAALAERLRERVDTVPLSWEDNLLRLSVSIGVAQWRGEGDSEQALLARADAALYRAKARGRNLVERG